jgi:hypothetical protein
LLISCAAVFLSEREYIDIIITVTYINVAKEENIEEIA